MKDRPYRGRPIQVVRKSVLPVGDLTQELLSKVVAIVDKDVIAIRLVPPTQSWNQHMVDLELSHCQYRLFRVFAVEDGDCVLK